MNPLERWLRWSWVLLSNLRPYPLGRLPLPVAFIGSWTVLALAGVNRDLAFVCAALIGVTANAYPGLRLAARSIDRERPNPVTFWVAVAAMLLFACVLVILANPFVLQRFLSIFLTFFAAILTLGILGDRTVLDRFAPLTEGSSLPMPLRKHFLMLRVFAVLFAVACNEALLVVDAALWLRVVALASLPIVMHYLIALAAVLTYPKAEIDDR